MYFYFGVMTIDRHYNDPYHSNYQDYDVYPNSGGDYGMVYDSMNMSVGQYQPYGNAANYADHSQYSERPPTPPSPSERSDSPPPQQLLAHGNCLFCNPDIVCGVYLCIALYTYSFIYLSVCLSVCPSIIDSAVVVRLCIML